MKKIIDLLERYEEIVRYFIVGILTTFVSLITYFILVCTIFNSNVLIELQISNIIAWFISATFAYYANKIYVFKLNNNVISRQILNFYISRVFVLIIDMLLMYIFVSVLKFNDKLVKLFVQIFVIIFNYFISKFIIFRGCNYENF